MINKPHVKKAYFQEKGVHIVIKIRKKLHIFLSLTFITYMHTAAG